MSDRATRQARTRLPLPYLGGSNEDADDNGSMVKCYLTKSMVMKSHHGPNSPRQASRPTSSAGVA